MSLSHTETKRQTHTGRQEHVRTRGAAANAVFLVLVKLLAALSFASLVFVIAFIVIEALPTFQEVSLSDFLFGQVWMPIDFTGTTSFGIFNFIVATVLVSVLALLCALAISIGAAVFLCGRASIKARTILIPLIDLLAGVPSVVFGFIGLEVVTVAFRHAGVSSGSCVLAAALVLAVMILPFLVSSITESLDEQCKRYQQSSDALGVSRWQFLASVALSASRRSILMSLVLAAGRAMGETMAVMMVIGDANLFPTLLGKSESIAALIALEMGTAVVGSTHYHALYAAGLVLMILVGLVNVVVWLIKRRVRKAGV
ncbi:MAG: phosphate ABC transporter permease subunit PstC [Atopobiaceae bacterium]|jgi:phosphate transport system permease protein